MKKTCTIIGAAFCILFAGLAPANGQWTMSFSESDFTLNPVFNIIPDFNFEFVFEGDLVRGTYVNPPLQSVTYNVFGQLPEGSPSGFPSFNLIRNIGGQEFYNQGSSMNFEILQSADLSDGLQANEVNMSFVLNCREVDTGRYHPPLFELFGDGTGRIQNSNNTGGINPGNGMKVDIDFGEEYIIDLSYTPAALTLSTDIGVDSVLFDFPNGLPQLISPEGGTTVRVEVAGDGKTPEPDSGFLFYDIGNGFQSIAMTEITPNVYDAVFPAIACGTAVNYYFAVNSSTGTTFTSPSDAPAETNLAFSANGTSETFADDFESDLGWAVTGDATDGQWERGVPAGDGDRGDPVIDADGSGACFLTDNVAGNSDVDSGETILTSPIMNAVGTGSDTAFLSYSRWYSNDFGGAPNEDIFVVEISNDGGSTWVNLETVGPAGAGTSGGWIFVQHQINEFVVPTNNMRVRFNASDFVDGSVIEAGVDGVQIELLECVIKGDVNGDGSVDLLDVAPFIDALNGGDFVPAADTNCDGSVNLLDVSPFVDLLSGG